jgi:alpha-beta hydrolase superfamily lysophospholipase
LAKWFLERESSPAFSWEEVAAGAGATDKTLKLYEGGFHDLLNDIDKELVMQDIKGWINTRLPAVLSTPVQAQAATR